jgi:predicted metal-dependent hydrolase
VAPAAPAAPVADGNVADGGALFQRGVDDYHAGRHYEAHEHWEELWQDERDEPRRAFLQALIQVASATHKAINDVAPRGSLRLLDSAAERLAPLGEAYLGIDLVALRQSMTRCRAEIAHQLEASGHCRITSDFIPVLAQLGAAPLWQTSQRPPEVPAQARAAWFDRGLAAYQAGDFFEAHELWEELWRDTPVGADRQFFHGLIQVAAAMYKIVGQQKPAPAARLLARALDKLRASPPRYRGLDVARLLREGEACREILAAGGELSATSAPRIAP